MKLGILIFNGDEKRVKGASYDLLIDKEHLKSGIRVDSSDTFIIDPFDYIVVGAKESVNLPRNICGTFDTKVSMFCKGIILSNGPQVDPGYQGRLLCLLFNTSAREFVIEQSRDFEFSTIQFSTLSQSTDIVYLGRYQRKPELRDYIGHFADQSIAGLVKSIPEIRKKLDEVVEKQKRLSKKKFSWGTVIIVIIVSVLLTSVTASYYIGSINEKIENQQKEITKLNNAFEILKNTIPPSNDDNNIIDQNKSRNSNRKKIVNP